MSVHQGAEKPANLPNRRFTIMIEITKTNQFSLTVHDTSEYLASLAFNRALDRF